MNALIRHFGFEFRTGVRNSNAMLLFYLFPLGFSALMGLVMVEINPGFGDVLIPAMVVFTTMVGTLLGLPSQIVDAREAGVYRSFRINGVPVASILAVPMVAGAFHAILCSAVIAATAHPLFGVVVPADWAAFALITVLSALAFGGLAALIGVVSTSSRATVLWSQLIFLPSMLLGGLMVDLGQLPANVLPISKLLPTTYAMQAFLGYAYETETVLDPLASVLVLVGVGVVAFTVALALFSWDRANQTRRLPAILALLVLVPLLIGALAA